jgi:hypothetical protein
MESLALLVSVMLLVMLMSSAIALIVAIRARTSKGRFIAVLFGLPGGFVGVMLLISVGSLGGKVFGMVGLFGCLFPAYLLWKSSQDLVQD